MGDRMAAEIWIGGKLPRSLLDEFPISDLRLDWDNARLASSDEADILAARDEDGLLHFMDAEAAWGQFEDLEGWLREHNITTLTRIPFAAFEYGEFDAWFSEFSPCSLDVAAAGFSVILLCLLDFPCGILDQSRRCATAQPPGRQQLGYRGVDLADCQLGIFPPAPGDTPERETSSLRR